MKPDAVRIALFASPIPGSPDKPLRTQLRTCTGCGCSGYTSPQAERLATALAEQMKVPLELLCDGCENKRKPQRETIVPRIRVTVGGPR